MINVQKKDERGQVTWQYPARVLQRGPGFVRLEAFFNRADMPFQGIVLKQSDRFVETFYMQRWYNIFAIYDRDDGAHKGWYCNVARPAVWDAPAQLSYIDLALDLWVTPAGVQTVLDEDEFELAALDARTRAHALSALAQLQRVFNRKRPQHLLPTTLIPKEPV